MPRGWPRSRPRLLLVKISSLGDVVANLPVVTDILRRWPDAQIDWVVEEAFIDIPRLHPGIATVIPVAQRRWREMRVSAGTLAQRCAFFTRLRATRYDFVLDTQGLFKSAIIAAGAQGPSSGYDWGSAREPLATVFYNRRLSVPKGLHAIERNRRLAAAALGYTLDGPAEYSLSLPSAPTIVPASPYCVLVHGSSREDKLWPEEHWIAVGQALATRGLKIVLPWGSGNEHVRSTRMAAAIPGACVPERLGLSEIAGLLCAARLVVGVDTGLTHLAAASRVPVVGLYLGSDPRLTGVCGETWHSNLGARGAQLSVATVLTAIEPLLHRWQEFARICALYARS
ncbi:MAG: lipopolysaccharide heptosyltransferase I [Pseudomonadota bacterium]|nr:lipopolysaccharide heptosyltransferase I [Pseudomonadota bacterium]